MFSRLSHQVMIARLLLALLAVGLVADLTPHPALGEGFIQRGITYLHGLSQ
ncbi:MAG: hypothetical protein HC890_18445 [Chloroflexaceae bacterium]|nr:hypothetical protein [Chloroflexaceae bacterium]